MTSTTRFRLGVAAAALAGCAVGGVAFGPAVAGAFQDDEGSTSTTTEDGTSSERCAAGGFPGMGEGFDPANFDPAAMTAQFEERLAEKVADGTITQEEADEQLAGIANGEFPTGGFGNRGPRGEGAEGEGFDPANFDPAAMTAQFEERLAEKVADGTITQEEADEQLAAIANGEFPTGGMGQQRAPRGEGGEDCGPRGLPGGGFGNGGPWGDRGDAAEEDGDS